MGTHPNGSQSIADILDDIRSICGPDTVIVLPALPMHVASLFPRPLSYLVNAVADAWDAQKELLSAAARSSVLYVAKPTECARYCTRRRGAVSCSSGKSGLSRMHASGAVRCQIVVPSTSTF